ncbi:LacI family DNA-binding transcriptional regulator [Arthrobacter sp. NPDC056691]|uniref:LacI family DNA-binding transcriptional regulator n=1 Tax=Arthrobacter sp. NPDC056691 TaxID=3345913 RepID=UPI00366E79CF
MTPSDDQRRPTIRDVAQHAGVSKSLAAMVFQGSPRVSEERRERVLSSAQELGYNLNWAARSLKADPSRNSIVGLVIRDLRQPWASDLVDGARPVFEAAGYKVLLSVLSSSDSSHRTDFTSLEVLRDIGVAGILAAGSVPDGDAFVSTVNSDYVVFAGWEPTGGRYDAVRSDDELGMSMVIDHLVGRGHKRIAHIGGHGGVVAAGRQLGYENSMRSHGLADRISVRSADFSAEAGYRAATDLLAVRKVHRPTALACVNDLAALGAMRAADDLGIPVAVTGYDNIEIASLPRIGLTTVDPQSSTMGARAADFLVQRLNGSDLDRRSEIIAPYLVVRSSSARQDPAA